MEEKGGVEKAMEDLEELYSGVPDDSVDLTFEYLMSACEKLQNQVAKPKSDNEGMEPIIIGRKTQELSQMPIISHKHSKRGLADGGINERESLQRHEQCRGIPHSNICALCSSYIHIFRHHRCLVCGRVYCKSCVGMGMGKMTEGRKCKECLGRRFSQRYIKRAGKSWCCHGYPSEVKQQELIWAEKGPSKKSEGKNSTCSQNPVMLSDTPATARPRPTYIVTASSGFYSRSHRHSLPGK